MCSSAALRMRSATMAARIPSVFGRTTRNSSPPNRPTIAVVQEIGPLVGDRELQETVVGVAQLLVGALQGGVEVALLERRAQDGVELVEVEGLDEVIVGAVLQALDLALDVPFHRHHDDRDGRQDAVPLDGAHHLKTVGRRDQQVEKNEVGTVGRDPAQRLLAGRGGRNLVSSHRQPLGQQIDAVPIVIHDQDAEFSRRHRGGFRWSGGELSLHGRPRTRGVSPFPGRLRILYHRPKAPAT